MADQQQEQEESLFPSFDRIGYRIVENGQLVPVDRDAQRKFSEFILGEIAKLNARPAPR